MTEENQQEQPESPEAVPTSAPDTLEINDLDQFVQILLAWHQDKVKRLEHMLTIPEGVEVMVNEGEAQELSGDLHKGFLIGLTVGLMELGILPFATSKEGEEQAPAANDSGATQAH